MTQHTETTETELSVAIYQGANRALQARIAELEAALRDCVRTLERHQPQVVRGYAWIDTPALVNARAALAREG